MTCNIKDRFFRIVAGTAFFVILTTFNTGWTAEFGGDSKAGADSRPEAALNESDENQPSNPTVTDENQAEAETDGNASSATDVSGDSKTEGRIEVAVATPNAEPLIESSEAMVDATYHFVEDVNSAAQGGAAETVAQDIGASVDASVKEDIRANVQEVLQTELISSLPLPGQD